ncbi:MAG: metallophosphoesterase family protein [Alistipes sp.]|nr:metallophosphoesterase family protein [Alistipes sp.]
MIQIVMFLVALLTVVLDIRTYKRLCDSGVGHVWRYSFLGFIVIANLLLWAGPALMFSPWAMTAQQPLMRLTSLSLTLYILLTLPRLLLYALLLTTRRRGARWLAGALSAALLAVLVYGVTVTRTDYRIKPVVLHFDNLPKSFDGYRIAFISDIHIGSMCNAEKELEQLSHVVESTRADLLAFGGDLVNLSCEELSPAIVERLSRLRGRDGTVAILGNHDTGTYIFDTLSTPRHANIERVCEGMRRAGWRTLRDSTEYLRRGCDSIAITGIDYTEELLLYKHSFDTPQGFDPAPIFEGVEPSLFNITLSHLPQLWHPLCEGGFSDLTLSGHVHATQIKAECGKIRLSPAMLMYREWSGLYSAPQGSLYITDGIGYVGFYGRFGANPEVTLIELRCK